MYKIFGYSSFNGVKVLIAAEEIGVDYEYVHVDLGKLENKKPEFLAMNPMGKIPVLQHNGLTLIESNSICRYLANTNDKKLYSGDPAQAAKIDQTIDVMTQHIGRHLSSFFWQEIICVKFFKKEPKQHVLDEARGFLEAQLPYIDGLLLDSPFLCGGDISIADTIAFSYFEITEDTSVDISGYEHIVRWYEQIKARPAVARAKANFPG